MDAKSFASTIAKRLGKDAATINRLTDAFASVVAEQCCSQGKVAIPGFGTFSGVKHDEEVVTDLSTGSRLLLPPVIEAEFVAGSRFRKAVSKRNSTSDPTSSQ